MAAGGARVTMAARSTPRFVEDESPYNGRRLSEREPMSLHQVALYGTRVCTGAGATNSATAALEVYPGATLGLHTPLRQLRAPSGVHLLSWVSDLLRAHLWAGCAVASTRPLLGLTANLYLHPANVATTAATPLGSLLRPSEHDTTICKARPNATRPNGTGPVHAWIVPTYRGDADYYTLCNVSLSHVAGY